MSENVMADLASAPLIVTATADNTEWAPGLSKLQDIGVHNDWIVLMLSPLEAIGVQPGTVQEVSSVQLRLLDNWLLRRLLTIQSYIPLPSLTPEQRQELLNFCQHVCLHSVEVRRVVGIGTSADLKKITSAWAPANVCNA